MGASVIGSRSPARSTRRHLTDTGSILNEVKLERRTLAIAFQGPSYAYKPNEKDGLLSLLIATVPRCGPRSIIWRSQSEAEDLRCPC